MNAILHTLAILATIGLVQAGEMKPSLIQWKPCDCSSPLMLPEGQWDVSMYGLGKYRIDGNDSHGRLNCIHLLFQAADKLEPPVVAGARESSFAVGDRKVTWRTYPTTVEGTSVLRREALMPNILPREKQGNASDNIWLRIDANSQKILDRLTTDAEEIVRAAAGPNGVADPKPTDPAQLRELIGSLPAREVVAADVALFKQSAVGDKRRNDVVKRLEEAKAGFERLKPLLRPGTSVFDYPGLLALARPRHDEAKNSYSMVLGIPPGWNWTHPQGTNENEFEVRFDNRGVITGLLPVIYRN